MSIEPEQFKRPDGTIDWGKYALARLKKIEEKEKAKKIIKPKGPGGYQSLIVYQQAVVISDLTAEFCQRFLDSIKDRRTIEQKTQAVRSGKQNIVEASLEKSLKLNIKLNGVSVKEMVSDTIFGIMEVYGKTIKDNRAKYSLSCFNRKNRA